ncbi:hypothetical protein MKW94_030460, partial [Papaver nudicaule]|nr:hypothetical protein [Papaver nudicaule]
MSKILPAQVNYIDNMVSTGLGATRIFSFMSCENDELSVVAKQALLRVLEEIKSHSTTHPSNTGVDHEKNLLERDEEDIQEVDTTVKAPIRKKTKGEPSKRYPNAMENGKKGKRTRKSKKMIYNFGLHMSVVRNFHCYIFFHL